MAKKDKRFQLISNETVGGSMTTGAMVLMDTETGILYLFATSAGYAGGLTPLLDTDGKPLRWQPEDGYL